MARDSGTLVLVESILIAFGLIGNGLAGPEPLPANMDEALPRPDNDELPISRSAIAFAACTAAVDAEVAAVANSDSFSPTQVRANHRPPAMPLISRLTCLQRRTGLPLRSRGMTGAKPVPIFGGGCTGNGLDGKG